MKEDPIFVRLESEVRSYCRDFPAVFLSGHGSTLVDEKNHSYIDFLSGAGTLNYGHNPPKLKNALCEYIKLDRVVHTLDFHSVAKRNFLKAFERVILQPRALSYKVQFTGPTGTNAVEASLKLARKVTGRSNVIAFTNAFHGVTLGSLAATANPDKRLVAGVDLTNVIRMPYDGFLGPEVDTSSYVERFLEDPGSGIDRPAAILLETVQSEGGVRVASTTWLRRIADLAHRNDIILIIDDIQMGCGRTGPFFSFEHADIVPDIVCLSKSLSGYGLPMSLVLIRKELDIWAPGEHNGTFRGHNLAFVTATAALDYWKNRQLHDDVCVKANNLTIFLQRLAEKYLPNRAIVRGRGFIQAIDVVDEDLARALVMAAFHRGLLIETCGTPASTLKAIPPLTISTEDLDNGLERLESAFAEVCALQPASPKRVLRRP